MSQVEQDSPEKPIKLKTPLYAFWSVDYYPNLAGAKIEQMCPDGRVIVEGDKIPKTPEKILPFGGAKPLLQALAKKKEQFYSASLISDYGPALLVKGKLQDRRTIIPHPSYRKNTGMKNVACSWSRYYDTIDVRDVDAGVSTKEQKDNVDKMAYSYVKELRRFIRHSYEYNIHFDDTKPKAVVVQGQLWINHLQPPVPAKPKRVRNRAKKQNTGTSNV